MALCVAVAAVAGSIGIVVVVVVVVVVVGTVVVVVVLGGTVEPGVVDDDSEKDRVDDTLRKRLFALILRVTLQVPTFFVFTTVFVRVQAPFTFHFFGAVELVDTNEETL